MIYLFSGDNSFEIDRAVKRLTAQFAGEVESIEASEISLNSLPDLLFGGTLFTSQRMIVIKELSSNSTIWASMVDYADKIDTTTTLILIEPKPDKRTKAYKLLSKLAQVETFNGWTDRDSFKAQQWVLKEVAERGLNLNQQLAQQLVTRAGVDQWRLHHALDQLSVLDEVTSDTIREIVALSPSESVFELFEAALRADQTRLKAMLATLELSEEPYKVFGLLSGQVFQLAALAASNKPAAEVAKDIGAHPFAVSKLASYARQKSTSDIKTIVSAFDKSDELMKTSGIEPWLAIERALLAVSQTR